MVVYERLGLAIHSNRHEDDMVKVCVSFKSLFPSSLSLFVECYPS